MDTLTTTQTAKILNVSKATINLWIDKGIFPNAYKLNPNARNSPYRIPHQDLVIFLDQQTKTTGTVSTPGSI